MGRESSALKFIHFRTPDKTAAYYAALKCGHAKLRVVSSDRELEPDRLAELTVLVLGGVRYVEPEEVLESSEATSTGSRSRVAAPRRISPSQSARCI